MVNTQFYVVGGEYTDTSFTNVIPGTYEEHGPMSYDEAHTIWARRAWGTVDNATYRFTIVPASEKE